MLLGRENQYLHCTYFCIIISELWFPPTLTVCIEHESTIWKRETSDFIFKMHIHTHLSKQREIPSTIAFVFLKAESVGASKQSASAVHPSQLWQTGSKEKLWHSRHWEKDRMPTLRATGNEEHSTEVNCFVRRERHSWNNSPQTASAAAKIIPNKWIKPAPFVPIQQCYIGIADDSRMLFFHVRCFRESSWAYKVF